MTHNVRRPPRLSIINLKLVSKLLSDLKDGQRNRKLIHINCMILIHGRIVANSFRKQRKKSLRHLLK